MELPVKRSCIPELLARKNKLQTDMAKATKISNGYISQVISLKIKNPSAAKLRKIAKYLDCYMDDLYEWDD